MVVEGLYLALALAEFDAEFVEYTIDLIVLAHRLQLKRVAQTLTEGLMMLEKSHGDGTESYVGVVMLLDKSTSFLEDLIKSLKALCIFGVVESSDLRV